MCAKLKGIYSNNYLKNGFLIKYFIIIVNISPSLYIYSNINVIDVLFVNDFFFALIVRSDC